MGLSLDDIQKGIMDWGTVIAGTVGKANEIIKETRGITASPTSTQKNLDKTVAGTVAQQTATKGTVAEQVAVGTPITAGQIVVIMLGFFALKALLKG